MWYVGARLTDESQIGEPRDDLAGHGHPLLREQHGLAAGHLLDDARRVRVGVGVNDDVVPLQPLVGARRAKDVRVVVNHRDFHGPSSKVDGIKRRTIVSRKQLV